MRPNPVKQLLRENKPALGAILGIPSHDTFDRVLARIDPKEFERCDLNRVKAISKRIHRQIVSLDGKELRRSHDRTLSNVFLPETTGRGKMTS